MFVRNSLLFEVTFTVSFKTILRFSCGPSPLCISTRLLRPLLLNLSFLKVTSWQQCLLLHRHNISVHLNSSLSRPGSLLSCCLSLTQYVRGKKIATASAVKLSTQSFDRNLCHFRSYTIFQFFLRKSIVQRVCVHFQFFELW